jgi:hypothetical protein
VEVVALEHLHGCMSAAGAAMKVVTSPPHTAPNPMFPRAMFTAARETAGLGATGSCLAGSRV